MTIINSYSASHFSWFVMLWSIVLLFILLEIQWWTENSFGLCTSKHSLYQYEIILDFWSIHLSYCWRGHLLCDKWMFESNFQHFVICKKFLIDKIYFLQILCSVETFELKRASRENYDSNCVDRFDFMFSASGTMINNIRRNFCLLESFTAIYWIFVEASFNIFSLIQFSVSHISRRHSSRFHKLHTMCLVSCAFTVRRGN